MTAKQKNTVSFDVDALEREDTPEPFTTKLGGRKFQLVDPAACSWEDLAIITSQPASFLAAAVGEKDREAFIEALGKLPTWKVNALSGAYREHFALTDSGEAGASPTS